MEKKLLTKQSDVDPSGLGRRDFSVRVPERSEMFDARDSSTYIHGCDYPKTSDYAIVAAEAVLAFGAQGRLCGQIVEICPGPGNLCGELLRRGADRVVGIDGDPVMIDHASRKFSVQISNGQMQFLVSTAQELPLEDNVACGTVNFNSFHQFQDEQRALMAIQEMVRVIEPNGWGFIRDFRRGASKSDIEERLKHTKPKIIPLLLDSIQAAFTRDEFIDLLRQIPGIEFSVSRAKDPRRLSGAMCALIENDPVEHWRDFAISQEVKIRKLK